MQIHRQLVARHGTTAFDSFPYAALMKNRKLAAGCCRGVKGNVSKRTNSEWTTVPVSPTGLVLHWNFPLPSQLQLHLALPPAPHLQSPKKAALPQPEQQHFLLWIYQLLSRPWVSSSVSAHVNVAAFCACLWRSVRSRHYGLEKNVCEAF